jgi:hypothetical protein
MSSVQDAVEALTIFVLVKTQPEWLRLSVPERFQQIDLHMKPVLKRYQDQVKLRFYDTEFFSARVTDIWVWEAKSRQSWELVAEALRETPLWDGYFSIVEILAGVENAYARNYEREAMS